MKSFISHLSALLASSYLCACATTGPNCTPADPSMACLFKDYQGRRVTPSFYISGCETKLTLDEEGDWRICGGGADYVKVCSIEDESWTIYPVGKLCLVEQ